MAKRTKSPSKPKGRKKRAVRKAEKPEQLEHRSAQELGVTYPGSYCDDAETVPHYWIEVSKIEQGSLFQCKLCHRYLWLPLTTFDADTLGKLMRNHGITEGYCRYLNTHRLAKVLMAKLQDLRRLELGIADKVEFARIVDRILSDKEYDKKEVKNGK